MSDSGKEDAVQNVNLRIYTSLLKRDSKEKHVTVCRLIEANDKLVRLVSTLKLELDEVQNKLDTTLEREYTYKRRLAELEVLLKEKDCMINRMMSTNADTMK